MCLNKNASYKKYLRNLIESEKRFIFKTLNTVIEDFDKCYICGKKVNEKTSNIINLPSETFTTCLCNRCFKHFTKQRIFHERLFYGEGEKNIELLKNNQIKLISYVNEQVIKVCYANKLWLDRQRRINGESTNKHKG